MPGCYRCSCINFRCKFSFIISIILCVCVVFLLLWLIIWKNKFFSLRHRYYFWLLNNLISLKLFKFRYIAYYISSLHIFSRFDFFFLTLYKKKKEILIFQHTKGQKSKTLPYEHIRFFFFKELTKKAYIVEKKFNPLFVTDSFFKSGRFFCCSLCWNCFVLENSGEKNKTKETNKKSCDKF